jgi:Fe-S-cluster-containing dehydrogenase component
LIVPDNDTTGRQADRSDPQHRDRREFISAVACACGAAAPLLLGFVRVSAQTPEEDYDTNDHFYGMGVDVNRCIGCGRCVKACTIENDVPEEPHFTNTWIERYIIRMDGEVEVDSPNAGMDGFAPTEREEGIFKTFFVPKLCNQCEEAPCVQVCPVGATFTTEDGVVLVDEDYCIGCRYCIQACPYGARYLHPERHVAGKCTFCYHRLVDGLVPACVEVCPTSARVFGELEGRPTPLDQFLRFNTIQVLKPHLNTKPKVFYANLDVEVR